MKCGKKLRISRIFWRKINNEMIFRNNEFTKNHIARTHKALSPNIALGFPKNTGKFLIFTFLHKRKSGFFGFHSFFSTLTAGFMWFFLVSWKLFVTYGKWFPNLFRLFYCSFRLLACITYRIEMDENWLLLLSQTLYRNRLSDCVSLCVFANKRARVGVQTTWCCGNIIQPNECIRHALRPYAQAT